MLSSGQATAERAWGVVHGLVITKFPEISPVGMLTYPMAHSGHFAPHSGHFAGMLAYL